MVTNLAEWHDSILWLEVKPGAGELKVCATGGKARGWLNLLHDGLTVEVEFQVRAVGVDDIHSSGSW